MIYWLIWNFAGTDLWCYLAAKNTLELESFSKADVSHFFWGSLDASRPGQSFIQPMSCSGLLGTKIPGLGCLWKSLTQSIQVWFKYTKYTRLYLSLFGLLHLFPRHQGDCDATLGLFQNVWLKFVHRHHKNLAAIDSGWNCVVTHHHSTGCWYEGLPVRWKAFCLLKYFENLAEVWTCLTLHPLEQRSLSRITWSHLAMFLGCFIFRLTLWIPRSSKPPWLDLLEFYCRV